ncbi:DUF7848 domain-containing protein [Streptomyces griseosporeus]|uniref:DUF7848 domain-containing protein n=1 Tax=Streptomyces griseosporeus TaxID=1910 RepID=UPI00368BDE08
MCAALSRQLAEVDNPQSPAYDPSEASDIRVEMRRHQKGGAAVTAGVKSYAYPEIDSIRASVDDLPVRRWVECASCIESQDIESTGDADMWAKAHFRNNPHHDRFRIVRQTGWRMRRRVTGEAPE